MDRFDGREVEPERIGPLRNLSTLPDLSRFALQVCEPSQKIMSARHRDLQFHRRRRWRAGLTRWGLHFRRSMQE